MNHKNQAHYQRNKIPHFSFNNIKTPRIFKGNWQLSGGHGDISTEQAIQDLIDYAQAGFTTLDTGDIYGDSEAIIGEFRQRYGELYGKKALAKIQIHTKFVPDLNALEDLTFQDVERIIKRSCDRLGVKSLDLVQFHWWNFEKGDYITAAKHLARLQSMGRIKEIGLTNFDCKHAEALIDAGIPIASNQIQFSLFDSRPFNGMFELAKKYHFAIFCYGVLAGGLISNTTIDPANRSHTKYKLVLDEVGDTYYKKVLQKVHQLAEKYNTSAANIAIAYALQTRGVSAVIIGPRNTTHLKETVTQVSLSDTDYKALRDIQATLRARSKDDIYSYERDFAGKHGKIMKYNQNNMRGGKTNDRTNQR